MKILGIGVDIVENKRIQKLIKNSLFKKRIYSLKELKQEEWGIDIYLTGAQKALALPPALAILMYSPKAREISETQHHIPSYYSNLNNWWPIIDSYMAGEVKYFSTPATNLVVGLHEMSQQRWNELYKK